MVDSGKQLVAVLGRGIIDSDEPFLTGSDFGVTRGDGCFDAMRLVCTASHKQVDHRSAHLARFARSCAALGLDCDGDAWNELIDHAVDHWSFPGESTIKLVITRGPEIHPGNSVGFCTITPINPHVYTERTGMAVLTANRGYASDTFVDTPWLLGGVKMLSYGVNVAASRWALAQGADEALFVSADGFALEGPTSAFCWRVKDELWTTQLGPTGILSSVTVEALFSGAHSEGISTRHGLIAPQAVEQAWLVSAVRGVCPIALLDGRRLTIDPSFTAQLAAYAGFDPVG